MNALPPRKLFGVGVSGQPERAFVAYGYRIGQLVIFESFTVQLPEGQSMSIVTEREAGPDDPPAGAVTTEWPITRRPIELT